MRVAHAFGDHGIEVGEILRCAPFLRQGTQDDGMSLSGMLGVLAGVEKKFQIAFGAGEAAGF